MLILRGKFADIFEYYLFVIEDRASLESLVINTRGRFDEKGNVIFIL